MPDTAVFDLGRILARVFGAFMGILASFLWRIIMWMTEVVMGIESVDRVAHLIEDAVAQTGAIFTRPALLAGVFMGILVYLGFIALRQGFGSGGGRTDIAKKLLVSVICLVVLGVYVTASQNASAEYEKFLEESEIEKKEACLKYDYNDPDASPLPNTKSGLDAKAALTGRTVILGLGFSGPVPTKDEICEEYSKSEFVGLIPNPPFLSASYIIKTGTHLASLLGSSVSEALELAPEDMNLALGGSGSSPLDCQYYISELNRRAEEEAKKTTGTTLGLTNDLGVYHNARAISDLWLTTIYRTAAMSQYGQSEHASDVYCRLLESRANVSPLEQHNLTIDAAAGNDEDGHCNMDYEETTIPGTYNWSWKEKLAFNSNPVNAIQLEGCQSTSTDIFLGKWSPHILGIQAGIGNVTSAAITAPISTDPYSEINAEEWPRLRTFEEENDLCETENENNDECATPAIRYSRNAKKETGDDWTYGDAIKDFDHGELDLSEDIFNWSAILNIGEAQDEPYDDWVAVSFNWCTGEFIEDYLDNDKDDPDATIELIEEDNGVNMYDNKINTRANTEFQETFEQYRGCLADIYYITSPETCEHSTAHKILENMAPFIETNTEWKINNHIALDDEEEDVLTVWLKDIKNTVNPSDLDNCLWGERKSVTEEKNIGFYVIQPQSENNPMVRVAEYVWAVFYNGFYEPSSFEKLGSRFLNAGMDRSSSNNAVDRTEPNEEGVDKTFYPTTVNGSHIYHPDFTGEDVYRHVSGVGDEIESASIDIDDIGKDDDSGSEHRLAADLRPHRGNREIKNCKRSPCEASDFSPFVFQQYRDAINYHHAVRLANFWAICQPKKPTSGNMPASYDPDNNSNGIPTDESVLFWEVRDSFDEVKLREVSIVEGDGSNSDHDRVIENIEEIGTSFKREIDGKSVGHTCAYVWSNAAARDDDLGTRTAECRWNIPFGGTLFSGPNKAVCTFINSLFNTFGAGPREWVSGDITDVPPLRGGSFEILPHQVQQTSTSSTNLEAQEWFEEANGRKGPGGTRIFTASLTGLITSVAMFLILATLLAVVLGAHIMLIVGLSMLPLFLFLGIIPAQKTQAMLGKILTYIGIAFGAKIITLLVFSIIGLIMWTLMIATEPVLESLGASDLMNLFFSIFTSIMLLFLAIKGLKTVRKVTKDIRNVYQKDAANLSISPRQPRSGIKLAIGRSKHTTPRQVGAGQPSGAKGQGQPAKPSNKQLQQSTKSAPPQKQLTQGSGGAAKAAKKVV